MLLRMGKPILRRRVHLLAGQPSFRSKFGYAIPGNRHVQSVSQYQGNGSIIPVPCLDSILFDPPGAMDLQASRFIDRTDHLPHHAIMQIRSALCVDANMMVLHLKAHGTRKNMFG